MSKYAGLAALLIAGTVLGAVGVTFGIVTLVRRRWSWDAAHR